MHCIDLHNALSNSPQGTIASTVLLLQIQRGVTYFQTDIMGNKELILTQKEPDLAKESWKQTNSIITFSKTTCTVGDSK